VAFAAESLFGITGLMGLLAPRVPLVMWVAQSMCSGMAWLPGIPLYILGSILPDVDNERSVVGRRVRPVSRVIGHRTWTHSIWPVIVILLLARVVPAAHALVWLALGILTHLVCDAISVMGICWFWPYPGYIEYDSGAKVSRSPHPRLYHVGELSEELPVLLVYGVICLALFAWSVSSGKLGLLLDRCLMM
jgi:hypothetical protein